MAIIVEACIDSAESALAAEEGGADRVELCANLLEGGTTPSLGSIRLTRQRTGLPVFVMIRPRGGDFCYSETEVDVMKVDVEAAREAGAHGIVLGLLTPDGSVDRARTAALVELARPLPVTFHRAIDMARDPFEALDALVEIGVERVLTSGQEASVGEGLDVIRALVERAADRIVVMPGCGITERNLERVVAETGAREIHVAAWANRDSPMTFRNPHCFMGGELRPPEFSLSVTDPGRVRALADLARRVRP